MRKLHARSEKSLCGREYWCLQIKAKKITEFFFEKLRHNLLLIATIFKTRGRHVLGIITIDNEHGHYQSPKFNSWSCYSNRSSSLVPFRIHSFDCLFVYRMHTYIRTWLWSFWYSWAYHKDTLQKAVWTMIVIYQVENEHRSVFRMDKAIALRYLKRQKNLEKSIKSKTKRILLKYSVI